MIVNSLILICFLLLVILLVTCDFNETSSDISLIPFNLMYVGDLNKSYEILREDASTTWQSQYTSLPNLVISDACASLSRSLTYALACNNNLFVEDIDQDGDIDIVLGTKLREKNISASSINAPNFYILKNDGNGVFTVHQSVPRNLFWNISDIADLNGDGFMDLIGFSFFDNSSAVWYGNGATNYGNKTLYRTSTHGGASYVTDYNFDGIRELVSTSSGSEVPFKFHVFSWSNPYIYSHSIPFRSNSRDTSYHRDANIIGDINNDNIEDFFFVDDYYRFYLGISNGQGYSLTNSLFDTARYSYYKFYQNANGLFYVNHNNQNLQYNRYRLNSDGTSTHLNAGTSIVISSFHATTDLNHDGLEDIVFASGSNLYYHLQNKNTSGFNSRSTVGTGIDDDALLGFADFNQDGVKDIVVLFVASTGKDVTLTIFLNGQ